jgi:hypothetical protein
MIYTAGQHWTFGGLVDFKLVVLDDVGVVQFPEQADFILDGPEFDPCPLQGFRCQGDLLNSSNLPSFHFQAFKHSPKRALAQ